MTDSSLHLGNGGGLVERSPVLAWAKRALTMAPASARRVPPRFFGTLVFFVALIVLTVRGAALLKDADTLWHVFVGTGILETGRFPTVDTASWTLAGSPWIAKEWLSQVILAAAHRAGGWPLVALTAAAAAALALALIAREAATRLPPAIAALIVAAAFTLVAGHTLARPHVLAWPVMIGWTILLMRAAEDGRAPSPFAAILMALWANLHGSYLFGLALIPAFGLEALLRAPASRRTETALGWILILVLAPAATMVHAYGPGALFAAGKVLGLGSAAAFVAEWAPTDLGKLSGGKIAILAGIAALVLSPGRLPPIRVALLIGLLDMAVSHERHLAMLGLIAPLILIEPIAERAGAGRADGDRMGGDRMDGVETGGRASGFGLLATGAAALAALAFAGMAALGALTTRPDLLPIAALDAAKAAGVTGQVFNEYEFGGTLITRGIPTYIDGRTELYGPERLTTYVAATGVSTPGTLEKVLSDSRIGWTLLRPDQPAAALLDHLPGWQRIFADEVAVVHKRIP
ncbi:hypothetical protein [Prosthecomicrobium hirschii]|uniref:hypothetical protein n=1 Tax=Prosthecodimorpha hirschii TaxID=665126 RepID=UPI00221FE941|nr:hypothetical protein [Prosthecomicrobium hirschii]MCW1840921.1 hypothetical protein [Prosthecomicrobium hirschii]